MKGHLMKRVLLVEDEASIRELEVLNLKMSGWEVLEAPTAERALEILHSGEACDAALLDIMLPGMDGLSLCETIRRENSDIGIIMVSAKGQESDKIRGLSIGADDYMTKPFDNAELLARLNALCRRTGEVVMNQLHYSDLTLDLNSAELHTGRDSVQLSKKEFELARLFLSHPQHTLSVDAILSAVWGMDSEVTDNNVMAYVSFLRKKLKYLNSNVTIRNIQQIGYRMEATEA